jgi:hypothetical protein
MHSWELVCIYRPRCLDREIFARGHENVGTWLMGEQSITRGARRSEGPFESVSLWSLNPPSPLASFLFFLPE